MATKETKVEEKIEAAAPAAEKKTRTRKAPAKKAAEGETAVKATRKPRTPKAAAPAVYVQYGENETDVAALVEAAKADFSQNSADAVKDVKLYIKPEDGLAYYVINGVEGKVTL